jgi:hypothetical protein
LRGSHAELELGAPNMRQGAMDEELELAVAPEVNRKIAVSVLMAPNVKGVDGAEPEVASPNVKGAMDGDWSLLSFRR